jgi:hypothetical protein
MASTILRSNIVSPYPVRTPILEQDPQTGKTKTNGGVSYSHTKWFEEVQNGLNNSLQLANKQPAHSNSPGVAGEIFVSANYLYVCVSTNNWMRAALASF